MAHCIEKSGYTTTPRCEICKANFSATITVGRPEFSITRFLSVTELKKALLAQIMFSVVAIVAAAIHAAAFLLGFTFN